MALNINIIECHFNFYGLFSWVISEHHPDYSVHNDIYISLKHA